MKAILRDHGKIIMAILGVVLMFVFALPTFRGMNSEDYAKLRVGTLNGRKITNSDVNSAQAEIDILSRLGLLGDLRHGSRGSPEFSQATLALALYGGEDQDQPTYWLLLTEEASHYDTITVGNDEVYRAAGVLGLSSADVNDYLKKRGNGLSDLRYSLSHLEMVEEYLRFLEAYPPRPISALELQGDEDLRQVEVRFAAIDAAGDWQKASEPTAEQLNKQFDLYKHTLATPMPDPEATAPGPLPPEIAGHHFPFGYKYPDRVTLEYLVFNRAAIRKLIKPIHEDEGWAREYYNSHPAEFQAPASAPATATAPTTAPGTTTRPWEQVEPELLGRKIDERTDQLMNKLVQQAQELAGKPWLANSSLPRESWVSYADIAATIAKSSDSLGYKPEYKTTEKGAAADKRDQGLMSSQQFKDLPGIGQAQYMLPVATDLVPVPFYTMATHVQELVKPDPKDPLARLNLQVGTEGPTPLKDKDGNQYLYRITTVDPSHEPANLDEVKQQVIDDFKKGASYDQCLAAVKAAIDKDPDVDAVAAPYKAAAQATDAFTRLSPDPKIQAIRDFVKTAFSLKEPPASHPGATAPANTGSATVLPDDSALRCYPMELVRFSPATGVDFGRKLLTLFQEGDPAIEDFRSEYLSLDALSQRLHYVPVTPPKSSAATAPAGK